MEGGGQRGVAAAGPHQLRGMDGGSPTEPLPARESPALRGCGTTNLTTKKRGKSDYAPVTRRTPAPSLLQELTYR